MKVDERKGSIDPRVGGPTPLPPQGGGEAGQPPPAPTEATDRVDVSSAARELARLRGEVGDLDTVDTEKVASLRHLMARGSYSADYRDTARKVLREFLGGLLA